MPEFSAVLPATWSRRVEARCHCQPLHAPLRPISQHDRSDRGAERSDPSHDQIPRRGPGAAEPRASGAGGFIPKRNSLAVWSAATESHDEIPRRGPGAAEPRASGADGFIPKRNSLAVWSAATEKNEKGRLATDGL